MDYKEKYEHGLECIQEILSGAGDSIKTSILRKRLQPFFPELKESEDESIRKAILTGLIDCRDAPDLGWSNFGGINIDDCIAWLEKQNPTWCEEDESWFKELELMALSFSNDVSYREEFFDWLKSVKDRVQHKVGPKFKVGDWITTTDEEGNVTTEKIIEFLGDKVRLIDINGFYSLWPKHELNYYHLWTIADAKDGDVLTNDEYIFIYNNTCILQAYCYYHTRNEKFYIEDRTHHHKWIMSEVKPATKEQRDLLFAKMRDSGHEWDAEKKELKKKIESKKLDAAEVIKWLNHRELMSDEFINRFKKYFGL